MKKVIIGIHGLSNKPEKTILENWWINAMNEGLEKVNSELELPEFELVYWADALYDKPMSQNHDDKDHDLYLHEPYISADKGFQPSEISKRKKLYDFILEQLNKIFLNEDYTLNYSFLTDAIMSRFFEDLDVYYTEKCYLNEKEKCQASDLIKSRMEDTLRKYEGYEVLVIGHSMGSIIAYDVMSHICKDVKINTFLTIGSPLGLPIIISKIAHESRVRYDGDVRIQTPKSVNKWVNMADLEDKIALNYDLVDEFTANHKGTVPSDFIVVNDYSINGERNPHKSYGYLRCQEFSNVLSEFILEKNETIPEKVINTIKELINKIKV